MKRIFITGATGYLGQILALNLAEKGNIIHALVRDVPKAEKLLKHPNIKLFHGSILDIQSIREALNTCEEAYHLAALASVWNRDSTMFNRLNVDGLQNVLECCISLDVKKVLFTSTAGVVGHSLDGKPVAETTNRLPELATMYEASKLKAENVAEQFVGRGLQVIIVNPSRVYGPGLLTESNGFTRLIKMYVNGKWNIKPGSGESIGNYVYIDDVIAGFLKAMKYAKPGERYLLGGENASYNEFFRMIDELSGESRKLYSVPLPILLLLSYLQLGIANTIGKHPLITPPFVRKYSKNWLVSSEKARSELEYSITPLKVGLQKTLSWLKEQN
ncbi:NAD-dependent epimerase/dehydratase family protein [Daejeonella sp.]|uniref:NAD-dependent epimerase/dehydratase family protein n=1 Tax=Daejeonella sp. TaxID=2805397 RepID=UPI0039838BB1